MKFSDLSDAAQSLADLTPEQRALLVMRMRRKAASETSGVPALRPVPRPADGAMPLSFSQQRLWFMEQWQPGSAMYNIPAALRIKGPLDLAALRWAFDEIVRRHEVLRVRIASGSPVQVVGPPAPLPIPEVDLAALPEPLRHREAERLVRAEVRRPFDLTHGLLLRKLLLRLGETEHVAVFNMHHIVSDGWSVAILSQEFATLYMARVQGLPSPLPELPLQYADYAAWQREWLQGEALEAQLDYWRQTLDGAPAETALPLARPRPAVRSGHGARCLFEIHGDLVPALRSLAQREGATLFMVLLAAFDTLLHRHSGETDLVVGTPVAGRGRAELEGLIGFFINNLALRADLSGDPPFRTLVDRVRDVALAAQAHQDLPFEKIVEELRPERDTSRPPVFQVVFSLQNTPRAKGGLEGLEISPLEVDGNTAAYDLLVSAMEVGGYELSGFFEHSTDLLDAVAAARLTGQFQALLAGAAADPGRRLSELPLLSAAERWQLLGEWNDTAVEESRAGCFHELWAQRAAGFADAVAVAFGGERLSYGELDRRANLLAHHLRALGVGPEVLVGIAMERSIEMVVAILAVWKAGGAYVPLDPSHPGERLDAVIGETGLLVIVTQDRVLPRLPRFFGFTVSIDGDWEGIATASDRLADGPAGEPRTGVQPGNLAYAIFTSGSTGRPKGVLLPHAGLLHLARAHEALFGTGPGESLLLVAPLVFDAAVFDLVMALWRGNTLWLARQEELLPGPALARILADERITSLTITPSALAALPVADGRSFPALRRLWVAGEACTADLVARWAPGRRFFNAYGPTEATVWVTVEEVVAPGDGTVPPTPAIGRPVVNRRVQVLDPWQQPAPEGAVGELCAGGAGLARGYLDRPDLTAERFVPDPFGGPAGEPGARLYRTGDLVRHLADGRLEFIGRDDRQVKVRGVRIEPGEVEAALALHPAVREAAVVAFGEGEGRRLAAFASVRPGLEVETGPAELRSFLRARLPETLVPSWFLLLPDLPRTSNGKLDRRALELIAGDGPVPAAAPETGAEESRTPAEELAAGILAGVLGVQWVGPREGFFDLGGHSLLATQVLSRVREAFGVEISLAEFFDDPTARGLAARCEAALRAGGVPVPPLEAAPRRLAPDGELPLSFAQQRLWFLQQLEPGSTVYNIPGGVRLRGRLDLAALAGSLGEITRRHEVLRTTFPAVAGRPAQEIAPWRPLAIPVADLAGLPAAAREDEARRLAEDEARSPFDLARGPLLRLTLLQLAPDDHALLFTMHHIVSDGWSMGVLIGELARLYPAAVAGVAGAASPLPELRVQYADFAGWQRQWLQGGVLEAQLAYWRERLAGLPPLLELPADRPRPAVPSGRGRRLSFSLGAPVSDAVRRLSRERGTTLFMTLFAGFQTLLARLAGQDDFAVGTPIAGRNRMEIEGLIGFFVNTLVLRADVERAGPHPTFPDLLARVRETALGAYAHQDLPFEQIVEELRPERTLSQTPLFQVMFALQNAPMGGLDLPGLALEPLGVEPGTARFDLTVEVIEGEAGLYGQVEHSTDLFDATTVERLLAGFGRLLAAACGAPEARLRELPLLSPEERHQLLVDRNDTGADWPRDLGVHQVFAARAAATPDAPALEGAEGDEDSRFTYAELERRANRLARHLASLGVGPEVTVGLCLPRSSEAVLAMLAVLKAGGAYLPLDPDHPSERIALLLEAAAAPVVLARRETAGRLPAEGGFRVVRLDEDRPEIERLSPEPLPGGRALSGNLAYVLFTSGSTGRPKGVRVEHRSIVRLVLGGGFAAFGPGETFLQLAPLAFDAATFEIWGALLHGARLVVMPAGAPSLEELGRTVASRGVTTLWLTAGLFHQMVAEGPLESLRGVRQLLAGGDALSAPHVRRALAALPETRLINGYGPTEGTTFTSSHQLSEEDADVSPVPIGRPIADTRVFVLDCHLVPVPTGVAGELYIGGDGLARDYLEAPALTAERFVPDAWSGRSGERLYRTGDRVRWLPGGVLQFLGRTDRQVKVRGFRVEPGGVEAALAAHPGVREAVVLALDEAAGGKRLAACVVPAGSAPPPAASLRGFLRERLPDAMVPSVLFSLPALPLTANGKVDLRTLARLVPGNDAARPADAATDLAGAERSPVEEMVEAIWCEVLGRRHIGPDEDFFDLGGHSLLAAQVVSRVRSAFGVELPLRGLFEAPTVAGLARQVAAALRAEEEQEPPIRPVPRDERQALPLSFAQERLWFLEQLQPGTATYNMMTAVFLDGPLDLAAFARSLGTVVERHESLRTRFVLPEGDGRQPVQVIDPPPAWPLPVADLSGLPADRREELAQALAGAEARRPFDLAAGPVLRPLLLRLSPVRHLALLAMHHIVSDAWSMSILVREMTELYTAYAAGEPSPLAPLTLQYADFAAWQRRWLAGEVLERQLAFWRGRLAGAPPAMALPVDRPRPPAQTFRGDKQSLSLDAAVAGELQALSRRSGTTLFMTLLAAFDVLLHRWTGDDDLVVGTPSANRNREEIEGVIGFFINSLALRVDLSGDPGVPALLARVRETTLAAYTHQDLPFEKIVAELETERDLSYSPLFQVMFQLQNVAASALELPGLTLRFPEVETRTAKFDLIVSFHESPEGLGGEWRYNSGLFDAPTVLRMTRHFALLLEGIAAEPERPISELPWLTDAERHQTLLEWNSSESGAASDVCYPDLFRERAEANPDAVAAAWEEVHLSYAALDRRSAAAASLLIDRGVGPDSVVGLLARRGPELPVAILAIQKAGGAWMPLDPAQPRARLEKMIEGSGAGVVLVEEGIEPPAGVPVLPLAELLAAPPAGERLPSRLQPGNIAYLLYTSGSTGVPKGVMVTHRGLREHMLSKVAYLGLGAADVVAQTAAPTFDISVWQLLAVLLAGGRVQMLATGETREPARLLAAAEREGITVLQLVPSLLRAVCEVAEETQERSERSDLAALRWLIPTGEALPPDLGRRWLALYPRIPMVDAYGPTECTDEVSHQILRDALPPERTVTPIGRPSRGIRLHVVDRQFRPVPIGVTGELCVAGVAVARGYRHDPARTAEAFVPDPFGREAGEPGSRLYRTGDLARLLPDGSLEYLGRRDRQVKIRGFRIETGEVEAALRSHPDVREATVLARPMPGTAEPRLVAYVVTEDRGAGWSTGLRSFLADSLPDSMIPAAFVALDSLPLSANGKLDVRGLPEPEAVAERAASEPPCTPLEREIAALWQEVLGTDRFGVRDNFFELGGDSIKGAILMHRLQRRLDREISVVALFDAPTVAGLAARLGDAETPHGPQRRAPVERRDWSRETPPLSFAQERLWFLQLLDPEGGVYNMPNAFRLRGPLEPAVLDRALCEVVRRHETLRTRFESRNGLPLPVVEPAPRSILPVADLATLPGSLRDEEARRLFTVEASRSFDLARGPVVRSLLLRLAPDEHGVLFVAHHIACDGWSMGLWAREVEALYTAFASGASSPLPEPVVQYADFARWQRSWLAGDELAAELEHWQGRLQGAPPYLDLPTDRPRPPLQSFRGEWEMAVLPAGLAAELRTLGQHHNASLFMVMLAAFQLLLSRLSGQDDVVVGSPIAGRVPEVEGLIGCFLNTLVLRTDLSGAPTFARLLGRVRETALEAFAHQDVPYEKLLEVLRPERDLSRNSLFQVLFNMLNAPTAEVRLPGVGIEGEGLAEASSKFDLTLYVAEQGEDMVLNLVYNADLFDRPRIQEMLRQYRSLLAQAVAAPEAAVASYSLLTPEAAAVLPDPAAGLGGRWEGTVHDLFAEWAARQPGRVALADRDGEWTYGELDGAVRRLAARLLAGGIEPGDRVAIYAHRGAALALALLGALRAGAAFVILDPIYPAARLVEILRLARPTGWLRLEGAGPLPEPLATVVARTPFRVRLDLPAGGPETALAEVGNPPLPDTWPSLGPDDVASHAFTSGSTGVPKGIVQTHGSMSFFLPWHRDVLGYGEADRHTMLSGLAHDPLQRDVFYSLGSGATLCIPDPDRIGEPGYLAEWMRRERVTVTNLTPAMAQIVTESQPAAGLPYLRCAVLAGDILTRLDVDRIRRLAPQARLVNVYGSTESHRALSYHLIGEADERGKQVLPLGRGKRGCQLLVLTAAGLRAGVGELGEVAIRSRHLAAGYLGDDALTRERFVANPFSEDSGDRLYRTGDLGRYRPNGEVEAAGRADQQVKIRGYRVEPGEIEAELGRIPGVREAVVVGRDDPASRNGGKRLVAYVVLDSVDIGEAELRELLGERLPAYMVPAVFVSLDELPLNPNGKVDRRALPEPAARPGTGTGRESVPPRDELERSLARIWEEVLGTAPIGVTDGFFELGGHSLLAVRLTARISQDLGQALPLAALFQAPTVEQLAVLLRRRSPVADTALVPLRTGGSRPPLFLVHPAGGQVFCYSELVRGLGPDQPVYGLQDTSPADSPRSLAGFASRYLKEVRAIQPHGPYLLAGWSFGGRVAFEMARQLDAAGEEVALVGMLDTGLVQPPMTYASDAELLAEVVGELPLDELRRADDPLAALVEWARQTGALSPDITLETARRMLDVFKAHLEVARTDRPQPYRGKVVFFAAEIQPLEIAADPSHGWSRLAGELELRRVPGDHVTMIHNAHNVRVVAERLVEAIEEAMATVAVG